MAYLYHMSHISSTAFDDLGRRKPGTYANGDEARLGHRKQPSTIHHASNSYPQQNAPDAAKSNRRTVLEVPFEDRYEARNAGVKYDAKLKMSYVEGDVPNRLQRWASLDYSYPRWIEDQMNGRLAPVALGPTLFSPYPHQERAAKAILGAYTKGLPGFLIADSTGLGKTLSIVAGIADIAKQRGASSKRRLKVLISCPKGAMPVWRQTLKSYADSQLLRPMILNYQQLQKLLKEPSSMKKESSKARKAKTGTGRKHAKSRAARNLTRDGEPRINFDIIVYDESHYLKNYGSSNMSMAAANIAKLHQPYHRGKSPFIVYSTATPGSTPLHLAIMSPLLSRLIDPSLSKHIDPKQWGSFLHDEGFHVSRKNASSPWSWISVPWYGAHSTDPKERKKYEDAKKKTLAIQNADTERIGSAWSSSSGYIARDPSDLKGWPLQQVEPYYIELDAQGREAYDEAWTRFRSFLRLKSKGQSDPKSALTENLRFRQKASLLKAPTIAEHALDLVDEGKQVFIGCQFLETVDTIEKILTARKAKWTEVSGRVDDKVANRLIFQRGEANIVLCTVTEAVSFHAGETLPDGSKATMNDRVTIMADIRQNPNDCIQQMGRCHREGRHSLCEFPVILDTVDVKVMESFITKARNLKKMKQESDPDYLDRVFEEMPA
jgi:superfamily II DNA or RNA helicase